MKNPGLHIFRERIEKSVEHIEQADLLALFFASVALIGIIYFCLGFE